ncbi:hypothetical protein ACIA8R_10590 [Nonomuraea sp. NPDC051191]|uniref:hypothetical protein n=1 Tax=Nonomuraea sp. NPDC051191 TaxID=3364372 RepID=UPI003799149F
MFTDALLIRRFLAGASLVLAPVCLILGMIFDPSRPGVEDPLVYARNPGAVGVSATLLHYAWVLFVPALIAAWQLPGMIGSFLGLVLVAVAYARAGWWFPAGVLLGIVVWLFGASAWNLVLGIGGPVILLAAFGAVGVSIIRMPVARERAV